MQTTTSASRTEGVVHARADGTSEGRITRGVVVEMIRVKSVSPLEPYQVRVQFTDGTQRVIDLERYLRGEVFEGIRNDPKLFRAVRVDTELGTIVWENGADIDPDVLYANRSPAWMDGVSKTV